MTRQINKNNMGPPIPVHSSHMHFDPTCIGALKSCYVESYLTTFIGLKLCIRLQDSDEPHHQLKVYPGFTLEGPIFCPGKQNLQFGLSHYNVARICKPGTHMFRFFNIILLIPSDSARLA